MCKLLSGSSKNVAAALEVLSDEAVQQTLLRPAAFTEDHLAAQRHKYLHSLLWDAATE